MIKIIMIFILLVPFTSYSQNWTTLGSGMNNQVFAFTVFNGELIAGGSFTTAGGTNANYIAKWNGTSWSALGTGMNNSVYTLTVYNNELIAGGYFTTAGGVNANYIAKWNGNTWSSLGTGMDSYVKCLISYNGFLAAGGAFTTAGGINSVAISKWDGNSWSAFSNSMNNIVHCFTIHQDTLFAGGQFSTPGNRVAKLSGNQWVSTAGVTPSVFALTSFENKIIYAGLFLGAGSGSANCIVGWDGMFWTYFSTGMNQYITSLALYGTSMVAGGYFTTAGGNPANRIAKWNNGWSPIGGGMNDAVFALTIYNGELIAGGLFTYAGNSSANYIAKWNDNVGINLSGNSIPEKFKVYQNYPNPFNPVTKIKFEIPEKEFVSIRIFDMLGREVSNLFNGELVAGNYETSWDGEEFSGGTYFCKIIAGNYSEIKKMVLIK